jgi:hypothetical protein
LKANAGGFGHGTVAVIVLPLEPSARNARHSPSIEQ